MCPPGNRTVLCKGPEVETVKEAGRPRLPSWKGCVLTLSKRLTFCRATTGAQRPGLTRSRVVEVGEGQAAAGVAGPWG